eukprot:TRINITY_DN3761_c0_g1_i1.p1 TRINITY_DN3761_c0_g1~~TRINITY_DN3761_c0_g1_i1.p1  ORF type:complete len:1015 (-),score=244.34 TRINITY_DN3761_c0_g1_i1:58-3102(-)
MFLARIVLKLMFIMWPHLIGCFGTLILMHHSHFFLKNSTNQDVFIYPSVTSTIPNVYDEFVDDVSRDMQFENMHLYDSYFSYFSTVENTIYFNTTLEEQDIVIRISSILAHMDIPMDIVSLNIDKPFSTITLNEYNMTNCELYSIKNTTVYYSRFYKKDDDAIYRLDYINIDLGMCTDIIDDNNECCTVADWKNECCYSNELDYCGVCNGNNSTKDIYNACCNNGTIDICGRCDGNNKDMDIEGFCCEDSEKDDCFVCYGGNELMDTCGVCNTMDYSSHCDVCYGEKYQFCQVASIFLDDIGLEGELIDGVSVLGPFDSYSKTIAIGVSSYGINGAVFILYVDGYTVTSWKKIDGCDIDSIVNEDDEETETGNNFEDDINSNMHFGKSLIAINTANRMVLIVGSPGDEDGLGAIYILDPTKNDSSIVISKISNEEEHIVGFGSSITRMNKWTDKTNNFVVVGSLTEIENDNINQDIYGSIHLIVLGANGNYLGINYFDLNYDTLWKEIVQENHFIQFGHSISSINDLDGDGRSEVVVELRDIQYVYVESNNTFDNSTTGTAEDSDSSYSTLKIVGVTTYYSVFFVDNELKLKSYSIIEDPIFSAIGGGIANVNDIDEDIIGDVVVGSPQDIGPGSLNIINLNSDGKLKNISYIRPESYTFNTNTSLLGYSLCTYYTGVDDTFNLYLISAYGNKIDVFELNHAVINTADSNGTGTVFDTKDIGNEDGGDQTITDPGDLNILPFHEEHGPINMTYDDIPSHVVYTASSDVKDEFEINFLSLMEDDLVGTTNVIYLDDISYTEVIATKERGYIAELEEYEQGNVEFSFQHYNVESEIIQIEELKVKINNNTERFVLIAENWNVINRNSVVVLKIKLVSDSIKEFEDESTDEISLFEIETSTSTVLLTLPKFAYINGIVNFNVEVEIAIANGNEIDISIVFPAFSSLKYDGSSYTIYSESEYQSTTKGTNDIFNYIIVVGAILGTLVIISVIVLITIGVVYYKRKKKEEAWKDIAYNK